MAGALMAMVVYVAKKNDLPRHPFPGFAQLWVVGKEARLGAHDPGHPVRRHDGRILYTDRGGRRDRLRAGARPVRLPQLLASTTCPNSSCRRWKPPAWFWRW